MEALSRGTIDPGWMCLVKVKNREVNIDWWLGNQNYYIALTLFGINIIILRPVI